MAVFGVTADVVTTERPSVLMTHFGTRNRNAAIAAVIIEHCRIMKLSAPGAGEAAGPRLSSRGRDSCAGRGSPTLARILPHRAPQIAASPAQASSTYQLMPCDEREALRVCHSWAAG